MGNLLRGLSERDNFKRGDLIPTIKIIEIEDKKIPKAEAQAWIESAAGIDLRIAGSLLFRDFSYNDVDLTLHSHPCKELIKQLPSANFPIEIFCRICGAVMKYDPETDTWTWQYSARIAAKTLSFPIDKIGISAKDFWDLERNVTTSLTDIKIDIEKIKTKLKLR